MSTYREWPDLRSGSTGQAVLRLQQLLAGANRFGYNARPGSVDGEFGIHTAEAVRRMKWYLGYATRQIDGHAGEKLRGYMVVKGYPAFRPLTPAMRVRKRARRGRRYPGDRTDRYPLAQHGRIIGVPYSGTHSHPSPSDDLHNWESCNAIDIAIAVGTPVHASIAGVIGTAWGPLDSSNPVLAGQRIHVVGAAQELYYAHLRKLTAPPGRHVGVGDLIGYSGSANGVAHLHFATKHGDPAALIGEPATPGYTDHHYPG